MGPYKLAVITNKPILADFEALSARGFWFRHALPSGPCRRKALRWRMSGGGIFRVTAELP